MDRTRTTILIVTEGKLNHLGYVPELARNPNLSLVFVDLALGLGLVGEFAKQFGKRGVARPSLQDVLTAENPDGAVVATAPGNRYAPTMALVAAGAHVLLEPGGITPNEWRRMAAASVARGLRITPALRQLVAAREALASIKSGRIGVVEKVEYVWRRRVEGAEAETLRAALRKHYRSGYQLPRAMIPRETVGPQAISFAAAVLDWPEFGFVRAQTQCRGFEADGPMTYVDTLDIDCADRPERLRARLVLGTHLRERQRAIAHVTTERGTLLVRPEGGRPVLARSEDGPPEYPLGDVVVESAEHSCSSLTRAWVASLDLAPDEPSNLPAGAEHYDRVQATLAAANISVLRGGEEIRVQA